MGATGLAASPSFALFGVGHLVGLSVGMAQLVGLVTGWFILLPLLTAAQPAAAGVEVDVVPAQARGTEQHHRAGHGVVLGGGRRTGGCHRQRDRDGGDHRHERTAGGGGQVHPPRVVSRCGGAVAVVRLRRAASRILALDMLTLILVALLVLYADYQRSPYYLDAALILALLAFIATLVLARYHGEGKVF